MYTIWSEDRQKPSLLGCTSHQGKHCLFSKYQFVFNAWSKKLISYYGQVWFSLKTLGCRYRQVLIGL